MDIAVIGMSGRFPEAKNIEDFYHNLRSGKDSVREFSIKRMLRTGLQLSNDYELLGFLDDIDLFDHDFFNISLGEAQNMDPHQRIILELAYQTFENAGYNPVDFANSNTSVFIGDVKLEYEKHADHFDPTLAIGNLNSVTAGRVSRYFNLRGTSLMVDTACSSSLVALHLACNELILGESDFALVCGINLKLFPGKKISSDNIGINSPDGKTKSFSSEANGTGSGEAAICVLLKPLNTALKDNDHIHGIIKGTSVNQDAALSGNLTSPSSLAQSELIKTAWKKANIDPKTISYIEAHGTGTKLGDPIEVQGIDLAFKEFTSLKQFCALSSVKSNIGHTNSSAGLCGFVKALLSLQHQELFPSLHFNQPNPFIDFINSSVYVNTVLKKWAQSSYPRRAGVSSFGICGTNCHVIIEEAEIKTPPIINQNETLNLFTISGKCLESLKMNISAFLTHIQKHPHLNLNDVAFTLNKGRQHFTYKIVTLADSFDYLTNVFHNPDDLITIAKNHTKIIFVFSDSLNISPESFQYLLNNYEVFAENFKECSKYFTSTIDDNRQFTFCFQYCFFLLLKGKGIAGKTFLSEGIGEIVVSAIIKEISLKEAFKAVMAFQSVPVVNLKSRSEAILEKLSGENALFLEIGNGANIVNEISESGKYESNFDVVSISNYADTFLKYVKDITQKSTIIDWGNFYKNQKFKRIELPSYQFNSKHCWLKEIDLLLENDLANLTVPEEDTLTVYEQLSNNTDEAIFQDPIFQTTLSNYPNHWSVTEQKLATIWYDILKMENLELDDDFFDLGGHSLNGNQVVNRIQKIFGLELNFEILFDYSTLKALATYIDAQCEIQTGKKLGLSKIPVIEQQENYEATHAQKRFWMSHQLDQNQSVYNMPLTYRFSGNLNIIVFERALEELIKKHEILRTVFIRVDDELKQKIIPINEMPFKLECQELGDNHDSLDTILYKETRMAFDLEKGPLIKAKLFKTTEDDYIFFFSVHHIIADGWSLEVIIKDVISFYDLYFKNNKATYPSLAIQYKDYGAWLNSQIKSDKINISKDYWLSQYEDFPEPLILPLDFPRPIIKTFNAKKIWFNFDSIINSKIKELGKEQNVTSFIILTALIKLLLYRTTNQCDIVVGSLVSNRNHEILEDQIGNYINTLPIRSKFNSNDTFIVLLEKVKKNILNGISNQIYPFDLLIHELKYLYDRSHNPLFDVGFTFSTHQTLKSLSTEDIKNQFDNVEEMVVDHNFNSVKADLWIHMNERAAGIYMAIDYNIDLFKSITVQKLIDDFLFLTKNALENPQKTLEKLVAECVDHQYDTNKIKQQQIHEANRNALKTLFKQQ